MLPRKDRVVLATVIEAEEDLWMHAACRPNLLSGRMTSQTATTALPLTATGIGRGFVTAKRCLPSLFRVPFLGPEENIALRVRRAVLIRLN